MDAARDEIAFLARSENRSVVLTTLDSTPRTRDDVRAETGVERVTLGRILGDFESRGWVEKTGGAYARTPTGEMIAGAFENLVDTVEAAAKLDSVVQWLPTDEMPFPLYHLGSADITLPSAPDPAAPTRVAGQRLVETDDVRLIMSVIVAEVVEACHTATVEGDQTFEAVFTPEVLDTIATDPVMATQAAEMLATDQVTVYRATEPFPFIMARLDDIAAFGVTDEENLPRSYFESRDETVTNWVEATYEEYKRTAVPVDPAGLSD